MTRLRIYSAGTGRLQFDSSGSAADVTEESIKRDFKSDLLLYYDPTRKGLRCYVKILRSGSEQFLADYEFDAGTTSPLESFRSALEDEIAEVGWTVERDSGRAQQLYDAIGSAGEERPDVSVEELQSLFDREGQIRIGTPDAARAVGVVTFLRRAFDDSLDIAVTYSGETGTHGSVDAVVIPGSTDRVTVTADQRAALTRYRLQELREALPTGGMGSAASAMRNALVDAGVEERLGLAVDAQDASLPGSAAGQRNAILAALLLSPLAVLAVVVQVGADVLLPKLTAVQGFYLPFAGVLDGLLPIEIPRYLFDMTSWHVILVSSVVIGVALVSLPPVQRTLTALTGVSIPGLVTGRGRGEGPTPADRADAAIEQLVALQRIAGRSRVDPVLGEFGLETGSKSARARTALAVQLAGAIAGVVVAVGVYLVTVRGAGVVFPLLTDRWTLLIELFLLGGILAVVGTVGAATVTLLGGLGGGNSRRRGTSSGGIGVAGPDSHRGAFDISGFESRVSSNPHQATGQADTALAELSKHDTPDQRSKRLANALLRLDDRVADNQFNLVGRDRELVKRHADRTDVGRSMQELVERPPSREAGSSRRASGEQDETGRSDDRGNTERDDGSESDSDDVGSSDVDDDMLYDPEERREDSDTREDGGKREREDNSTSGVGRDDDATGDAVSTEATSDVVIPEVDEPIDVIDSSDRPEPSTDEGSGEDGQGEDSQPPDRKRSAGRTGSRRAAGGYDGADRRTDGAAFPQFRYDAANTGDVVSGARSIRKPTSAWRPVSLDEECTATPVVQGDHVVVGTRPGRLYAVSRATGDHALLATTDAQLVASPGIVDGHVAVVTAAGAVVGYRIETDGDAVRARESWRYASRVGGDTATTASPTVADGRLFVVGGNGDVHAIDGATGDAVWETPYETDTNVTLSAPAVVDGTVYVTTTKDCHLHAIDAETGRRSWDEPLGSEQMLASPAVADGRLLIGDCSGTLYVVDLAAESVRSRQAVGDEILSSVAVHDGTAYVVSNVGGRISDRDDQWLDVESERERPERAVVTAFDTTRFERRWEQELDAVTISSPTVVDGSVVVGTNGGRLFEFDRETGTTNWDGSVQIGSVIQSSVAAVDGELYFPDHDGTVYGVVDDGRS